MVAIVTIKMIIVIIVTNQRQNYSLYIIRSFIFYFSLQSVYLGFKLFLTCVLLASSVLRRAILASHQAALCVESWSAETVHVHAIAVAYIDPTALSCCLMSSSPSSRMSLSLSSSSSSSMSIA